MIIDFVLFCAGILGILVFYAVLMHLSARMGEGMRLPKYYLLYYLAIFTLILTIPASWSVQYAADGSSGDALFTLLVIGNIIVMAVSFKYWWWLKGEFSGKGDK
ncbi:Uncharacterised protein [uncultured archaeon]|nr:Uncharacterised protein [uncultured archaeon]